MGNSTSGESIFLQVVHVVIQIYVHPSSIFHSSPMYSALAVGIDPGMDKYYNPFP